MPDYAAQRFNMVEAQLRTNDVVDPRLLAAMGAIPRERFVPAAKRALAYSDVPVEVAPGRYLLDPRSFAKLIELASVRAADTVLDVGAATGYSSAVLARLAGNVVALEQDAELVRIAYDILPSIGAANAVVAQGALNQGLKAKAPYDVIVVNGAIAGPPETLLGQLAEGGRLVAVLADGAAGQAELFLREHGRIGRRPGFDAAVPQLVGFSKTVGFVF